VVVHRPERALRRGSGWAAAFVLGAIVAPTDPVSAAATFSRIGVPQRVALTVRSSGCATRGA